MNRLSLFSLLIILLFLSCKDEDNLSPTDQELAQSVPNFSALGSQKNKISEKVDSLFIQTILNYTHKTSSPHLYRSITSDGIDIKSEKDSFYIELINFLNFETIDIRYIEQELSIYEKVIPSDSDLLKRSHFVLTEYYQTIEYDERKAIDHSTKLLDLSKKSSDFNVYFFKALENLVTLEVIDRDNISSNSYAAQYLQSASKYHPNDTILHAKALCLNGYAFCRRNKVEEGLKMLRHALEVLPKGNCYYDKQEILKIILFVCNGINFKGQVDLYNKHILILENEIRKCGDFCNINKIKAERLLKEGNPNKAIPLFLKSYDYILSNNPINHAQLGTILYYLYKAYMNVGNYEQALNTYYTESLVPLPTKIASWDKTKIFDDSKTDFTFYFMTIGYYSRIFYEKYKAGGKIEDLKYARELLDSSMVLIHKETKTMDVDKLLSTFRNSEEVYDLGILINSELYWQSGDDKYISDLYQCSEDNKLKILYSFIQGKQDKVAAAAKIQKVIDSLVLAKNFTVDIADKKKELETIDMNLDNSRNNKFLSKIQDNLDYDEVLVDYNIVDKHIFIHFIYKDSTVLQRVDFSKEVHSKINSLIKYQQNAKSDTILINQFAKEVYSVLFPIASLPYKITIIPDQMLMNLNFEILRNGSSQLMIDNHLITYSGSGMQYISTINQNSEGPKKIAAFFYSDRESIEGKNTQREELPGNIHELNLITSKYDDPEVYSGNKNTKDQFLTTIENGPYELIHIGTHGYSSKKESKDIRLYFRNTNYELDSIYGYNLLDKRINADLVILSVCDSGVGLHFGGEGKFDWARYFILSGANGVISSLWKVNDRASKLIFNSFYTSKTNSNKEKIREAKIKLKSNSTYSHPYYWGGFVYSR